MRIFRPLLFALLGAGLSGCGLLYMNTTTPWAYRSATPVDVEGGSPSDKAVEGKACARSLLYLVAWGDYGYAAAARDALKDDPSAMIYDVRTDLLVHSYALGLYTRVCTVVTGRAGRM